MASKSRGNTYILHPDLRVIWTQTFIQNNIEPHFRAGEVAAREGLPLEDCPCSLAQRLQGAWKPGWSMETDGVFNDLKAIDLSLTDKESEHE